MSLEVRTEYLRGAWRVRVEFLVVVRGGLTTGRREMGGGKEGEGECRLGSRRLVAWLVLPSPGESGGYIRIQSREQAVWWCG